MKQVLERRLVAVMFTDMVGYTALIQADERTAVDRRDRYMSAVERAHAAFGGALVQRLGDGSMSMFPSALAAAQAGIAMQRELAPLDISVRIGVHVGEVVIEPERLTGEAVNIASRIESFAVPGGVMLSGSAHDQLKNRDDVATISLGQYRLKNVGRPMELFAVVADGIVAPDPRALEGKGERYASLPANLPDPLTPLVGRRADLAALSECVQRARVVTITGPGGVGKTRLMTALGRQLAPDFLDGVAFISLAEVTQAANVLPTLAATLDVKEAEERTLGQGIVALIGDKRALLLLDNLEQVVGAASEVAKLVESCPHLHIVTTSRTPLRIAAEQEYPLAPLTFPMPDSNVTTVDADYPAISLFVERARVAQHSFALTAGNTAAVVAICRRLDGLPLAIELAAARLRLLSPEALLERLDHALNLLTTGPRDSSPRHQTLRAAIDWSHSLLTAPEQRLFRRMAVFAGDCAFADVEAVCAEPGEPALDELEALVDKALVRVDGQGARLGMLRTIAEYAQERLDAAGETAALRRLHARRYAALASEIRDGLEGYAGADQASCLERGILAEPNLLAALDALLARAREGDTDATETGLRMSGDLYLYWHIRGKNLTAREYATAFLAADAGSARTVGRAGALKTAGLAWWVLGQFERANDLWAESYRIAEELQVDRELCEASYLIGLGMLGFDLDAGLRRAAESIARSQAGGFAYCQEMALTVDGILRSVAGDLGAARARYTEALAIQRTLGDHEGEGLSLGGLASLAAGGEDFTSALDLYGQSLAAFETIGDRAEEARVLSEMAWTHARQGDTANARRYFLDSVRAYTDVASGRGVGLALIGLAATETIEGHHERAVQIAAAAEVYGRQEGIVNVYSDETPGRAYVDRARAALPEEDAARATAIGQGLTIKQALDLAMRPETMPE